MDLSAAPRAAEKEELLRAYVEAIGEPGFPLDSVPPGDFETAREFIDSELSLPSPEILDYEECLLEWPAGSAEGKAVSSRHTIQFVFDDDAARPRPGAQGRLRHIGGSHRVLVLSVSSDGVVLARAPQRSERRMHRRVRSSGIAILKVGNESRQALVRDISEGGVGLSGAFVLEAGEHLEMLLRLEGKRSISFECQGFVANCGGGPTQANMDCWLGISFTNVPAEMREEIRRMARDAEL